MLKKTLILALVLILLVGIMVFPASAVSEYLDYNDFITSIDVDGDNDLVTISIPEQYFRIRIYQGGNLFLDQKGGDSGTVALIKDVHYDIYFMLDGSCKLLLNNIPNNTVCKYFVVAECDSSGYGTPFVRIVTDYYDSNDKFISSQYKGYENVPIYPDFATPYEFTLNKPSGTYSASTRLYYTDYYPLDNTNATFYWHSFQLTFSISSLYRLQQETGKTNAILTRVEKELEAQGKTLDQVLQEQQQTNEKLDSLPGEIGDEMQGVIDSEKQEASNAGDSAAGELMDIIPNESQGFMDAIESLVSSMSYNGTEAKLPVPAIKIPAIAGVMDEIKLTDELSVDFGYWVQQMPGGALELVQILGTIALIVYCFKELYSMIAYAMTLRGGGSSE